MPKLLTYAATESFHQIGHQGETNLASLIRQYFFYSDMHKQIDAITKSCPECQPIKLDYRKEPYGIRPLPTRPFSEIAIDYKNLPNGMYCLVFIDLLTRMPDVAFTTSTSFEATKLYLIK